jgi:hypothetical protein
MHDQDQTRHYSLGNLEHLMDFPQDERCLVGARMSDILIVSRSLELFHEHQTTTG